MADIDKVIRGLERCLVCDTSPIALPEAQKAYLECEYTVGLYCGRDILLRDALDVLNNFKAERLDFIGAVAKLTAENELLKSQPQIVRCRDCKYRYVDGDNVRFNLCLLNHNKVQSDDWFCADGERRADDARKGEGNKRLK